LRVLVVVLLSARLTKQSLVQLLLPQKTFAITRVAAHVGFENRVD
jgi:hypothetical protein